MTTLERSALDLAADVNAGKMSPDEVVSTFVCQLNTCNQDLNAVFRIDDQLIQSQLDTLKAKMKAGDPVPLAGVPVIVKDNICVAGVPTTCGSKMLEKFRPPYNATVVEKLISAGAVIVGKANMDEFAMGSSNENSAFGAVSNPWDTSRVPGGSSGGSAAAVASLMAPLSLGSDTGGSIRQPASFCGVYGLKPTYGSVSRYGLVAFGSSLDQIGPFATNARDCRVLWETIAGLDDRDSTSVQTDPLDKPGRPLKIGLIRELSGDGIDTEVIDALKTTVDTLKDLGHEVEEVEIPSLKYSIATYYLLATAEASANLARFDGVRYGLRVEKEHQTLTDMFAATRHDGFGEEVKRRILLGTFSLSSGYYDAYYAKATQARERITRDINKVFQSCDVLLSPTCPTVAFKAGEKTKDPLAMYLSDVCTIPANLAKIPAISAPWNKNKDGLPIGIQLMASAFGEGTLLDLCEQFEEKTGWKYDRPI